MSDPDVFGQPVRELEELVRRAGGRAPEPEEDWFRLRTHLPPDERLVVDAALERAGRILPGSSRVEQWEAIAQEFLGEFAADDGAGNERHLGSCFRQIGVHEPSVAPLSADDRECSRRMGSSEFRSPVHRDGLTGDAHTLDVR